MEMQQSKLLPWNIYIMYRARTKLLSEPCRSKVAERCGGQTDKPRQTDKPQREHGPGLRSQSEQDQAQTLVSPLYSWSETDDCNAINDKSAVLRWPKLAICWGHWECSDLKSNEEFIFSFLSLQGSEWWNWRSSCVTRGEETRRTSMVSRRQCFRLRRRARTWTGWLSKVFKSQNIPT